MARRQPNGRPKIYLGKDGRYHCYVTVGVKPDGRLDRKHLAAKTATQVSDDLDELMAQRTRGATTAGKAETVAEWLTHWLGNVAGPRLAYGTIGAYRPIIERHIIPAIGQWRIDGLRRRLEPEHIEAMYTKLGHSSSCRSGCTKHLAPATVLKVHRMLRKAFKDATRRGRAGRNVCDLVDSPRARRTRKKAHTLTEVQAIIRTLVDDPLAPRWLLGILLGLRQGEVLGLHWSGDEVSRLDLDADPAMLHAVRQLQRRRWRHGCDDPQVCARERCRTRPCPPRFEHGCRSPDACRKLAHFCPDRRQVPGCSRHRGRAGCPPPCRPGCTDHAKACKQRWGGGLVEVDLKSEKSARSLALPPVLVEALIVWRERQQRECEDVGRTWDPAGLVFTTPDGGPVDPRRDHERWEQLLVRAGVADSPLHLARHDAGTLMVATGTDIAVVQEMLGHTDIRTTRDYVEVANDLKKQAVDRVAAALFDQGLATLLQPDSATTKPRG